MACDRRIATTQRERSAVDINDPAHAPHQPRARRRLFLCLCHGSRPASPVLIISAIVSACPSSESLVTLGPKVIKFIPLLSGRTRRGNSAFSHLEVVAFLLSRKKKVQEVLFFIFMPLHLCWMMTSWGNSLEKKTITNQHEVGKWEVTNNNIVRQKI